MEKKKLTESERIAKVILPKIQEMQRGSPDKPRGKNL